MSEKQAFSVLVRALGVLVALHGAKQAWYCAARLIWDMGMGGRYLYPLSQDVAYGAAVLVLGAIMIRQPDWIVRFAWPLDDQSNSN